MSETTSIEGLDPLTIDPSSEDSQKLIIDANRRIIANILKSYTGYYDVFSELIQNALDATEAQAHLIGENYEPRIWIEIDIANATVKVTDNGTGLPINQFRYFLKPNVSFKKPKEYRGQKGVGATFLAYGFSLLRVHSRHNGETIAAILRQGRQWAQDTSDSIPRPVFEVEPFSIPELQGTESGTSVQIALSGLAGERPRKFDWQGARSASQWLEVLRIKTPLGGVYLQTSKFAPTVHIKVIDSNGSVTVVDVKQPEYFYPHEIPNIKVATVKDIEKALSSIQGSSEEKRARLDSGFKRLDALWEIYGKEELVDPNWWFGSSQLTDEHRSLIERHNVVVYSAFLRSAKMWGDLNENLFKLNAGQRIIQGGLQLASDFMVQGELSIIPLTSTIGYQANSHVIVHFTDGSPDMGRKVFQPELKQLADILAVRCVTIFKRYLELLKPDTGATVITPDKELHEWKKAQEQYRDKSAMSFKTSQGRVTLLSKPQQEQDVIALYHQLVGLGVIRGISFFATSQSDRYDSLYQLDYERHEGFVYNKDTNPLGVNSTLGFPRSSEPRVLEYKYDFDALVRDFSTEVKYSKHVNMVVCWRAGKQYKERYYLNSLLIGDEGTGREAFGTTHQAFPTGGGQPEFEVCILEDLMSYLVSPLDEEVRQKDKYND